LKANNEGSRAAYWLAEVVEVDVACGKRSRGITQAKKKSENVIVAAVE